MSTSRLTLPASSSSSSDPGSMGPPAPAAPPSSQPSTSTTSSSLFNLQSFQEDCDSEYLEALEAVADAEAEDGQDDSYFFHLVAEAERMYPKDVLAQMIKELKQRGLVHFVQTHVIQRRADPRAILSPDMPDVKLIPILKSALSRILRKRLRLAQYSTPDDVVRLLKKARKIIILSGAGISVSVGIPDFRSKDGIYAQLQREGKYHLDDPTDMFDKRFFQQDPTCFYDFVHSLWPSEFTPSPTHYFIKLLEERGQLLRDYTQNIDTLEHQAGITRVLPCHGSFATASCTEPGCTYRCKGEDIAGAVFQRRVPLCPRCNAPLIDDDEGEDEEGDSGSGSGDGNGAAQRNGRLSPSAAAAVAGKPGSSSHPNTNGNRTGPGIGGKKGKAKQRGASKKKEKGWGPGESEEDDAEDEVWVQGGRAGIGLSATHAPTEVLGMPKAKPQPKSPGGRGVLGGGTAGPTGSQDKDSPKRPLRRSASGRLVETPLQAGLGQMYRNWKGVIKPDVVFFGEKLPDDFDRLLLEDRDQVDLLLVMGTSLKVAPVSELVSHIPHSTPVVLINRTPVTHIAMDVQLLGDADEIIGWLCRRLGWELPGPHSVYGTPKSGTKGGSGAMAAGLVPASQPDEKIPRGLLDPEYQPKRAGTSPVWLWPNAQGGRVVDFLENGARLDEYGRLVARYENDDGPDAISGDHDYDDDDAEDEDDGAGPGGYLGMGDSRPMTPDIRYLPPGVVGDSQASTSPALSYLEAARQPPSPTPQQMPVLMSDYDEHPDDKTAVGGSSQASQSLNGHAHAHGHASASASLLSNSHAVTETTLQMRTDPAVGKTDVPASQAVTDQPVHDRPIDRVVTTSANPNGDPTAVLGSTSGEAVAAGLRRIVVERRPREEVADAGLNAVSASSSAAKRARQDGPA
ncbi:NAD-dependent histone deacetylase sir2 [Tilletia horrida]|nr:NAD-dependent histone deacetylase sir2 [Tilletia horrida]